MRETEGFELTGPKGLDTLGGMACPMILPHATRDMDDSPANGYAWLVLPALPTPPNNNSKATDKAPLDASRNTPHLGDFPFPASASPRSRIWGDLWIPIVYVVRINAKHAVAIVFV